MGRRARPLGRRLRGRRVNLARLATMRWPEIADRGRSELHKRLDRAGLGARPRRLDGVLARDGDPRDPGALLDRFAKDTAPRLFPGADAATAALIAARDPDVARALVGAADRAMAGRFDLLGYRGLSFGDPIDWHLDPVSGRRAPLRHWTALDHLDAAAVGDHKVVWELSRHQWLVRLGQAYRLTGDERYAERALASLAAWRAANPAGRGVNWASSLEAALRLVSWPWSLALCAGSTALSPARFADALVGVAEHAAHVERYLSRYFSPNTHLTGEALGLLHAGVAFPMLRDAARWRRLGASVLAQELSRQVLADGSHVERATCYQRYTAEIYLHAWLLARRAGVASLEAIGPAVERMVDVLLALREPSGLVPSIGDEDGGALLPLGVRRRGDVRGLFATAAALFGRADLAWAAGGAGADALWMLGGGALAELDRLDPRPPAGSPSRHLPDGGVVVLRSGWDRRADQVALDVGPLGCDVSAGHGHADLLAVQVTVAGEPMIVDPGTYCYTSAPAWRDAFRGTSAHSTVMVDRQHQSTPRGPFGWVERPAASLARFAPDGAVAIVEGEHGAYARLADPVVHRRRLLWVKGRGWVIVDDLEGAASHRIDVGFQLAPIAVDLEPGTTWARARGRDAALWIGALSSEVLDARVIRGDEAGRRGFVSPDYGVREPAPLLVFGAAARLPLRIVTVLWPTFAAHPPAIAALADGAGRIAALALDGGTTLDLEDGGLVRTRGQERDHRARTTTVAGAR